MPYRNHELIPHVAHTLTPFSEYLFEYDKNCILWKIDTVKSLGSVFGYRNISAGSDLHVRQLWICAITFFTCEASSGVNGHIEGSLQESIQNTVSSTVPPRYQRPQNTCF